MNKRKTLWVLLAGLCAGAANGLFGAGGGMLLVPLLGLSGAVDQKSVFPCSVSIILPITVITLFIGWQKTQIDLWAALPDLVGSLVGGFAAGRWGKLIPVKWLHRALGLVILWGGIRYLC